MYGASGEVCWRVEKGCGEDNGEDVGKCVEVWGPNTLLIPHISLPSPFPTSPLISPTSHHTFILLLSYLFPHPSFLPPQPNTFSYYPHISLHLLKVWWSYHVTKLLWRSYCGEVTMWRSYWQPNLHHDWMIQPIVSMQLQQAQHCFVSRIPAVWNKLPDAVVSAPSSDVFKKRLNSELVWFACYY